MKRLIVLFVYLLLTGVGCLCDDQLDFWNVADMEVLVYPEGAFQPVDTNVVISSQEELRIYIINEVDYVASVLPDLAEIFIPDSYAFQCPDPGEEGMRDPITSLNFFSDETFKGIPPGESLNEFIRIDNTLTVEELLEFAPTMGASFGVELYFNFTEDPLPSSHRFTVVLGTESGILFEDQTVQITWE